MILAKIDQRARHAWTQRAKLVVQMLTTTAYGTLGVAFAEPILKATPFGVGHLVALTIGVVSVYLALYLAPEGERDDPV